MFHNLLLAYFGGFFLFWVLGLDQLFFLILCLVGFFSYMSSKKISPGIDVVLFAIFIFVTFFSVIQISTTIRYVTYIRNEGVYMAMLFVFLSATFLTANKEDKVNKLYFAILLFSVQCSIVAFLASRGISLSFKSLAGHFIPDLGSKYISGMLNKNSVQAEASWFSKGFYRPRGLMMYPNTMAGVLASTMAIKAYFIYKFWRDGLIIFALACLGLIFLDVFSIYSSLSRSTWIGVAIAFVAFPFAFKTNIASKTLPIVLGIVGVTLLFATGLNKGIESRLVDKTHSNEGRGLNYSLIWQETTSSIDKLLLGHGTQIDHWLLDIPLGSHSTYLGIFFKYGLFGFIVMTLFLIALYLRSLLLTRTVNRLNNAVGGYVRPYFLCFALIIPVVQMMFIEVDVDASYALYFSVIVLLIILECQIVQERYQNVAENVNLGLISGPNTVGLRT